MAGCSNPGRSSRPGFRSTLERLRRTHGPMPMRPRATPRRASLRYFRGAELFIERKRWRGMLLKVPYVATMAESDLDRAPRRKRRQRRQGCGDNCGIDAYRDRRTGRRRSPECPRGTPGPCLGALVRRDAGRGPSRDRPRLALSPGTEHGDAHPRRGGPERRCLSVYRRRASAGEGTRRARPAP